MLAVCDCWAPSPAVSAMLPGVMVMNPLLVDPVFPPQLALAQPFWPKN